MEQDDRNAPVTPERGDADAAPGAHYASKLRTRFCSVLSQSCQGQRLPRPGFWLPRPGQAVPLLWKTAKPRATPTRLPCRRSLRGSPDRVPEGSRVRWTSRPFPRLLLARCDPRRRCAAPRRLFRGQVFTTQQVWACTAVSTFAPTLLAQHANTRRTRRCTMSGPLPSCRAAQDKPALRPARGRARRGASRRRAGPHAAASTNTCAGATTMNTVLLPQR